MTGEIGLEGLALFGLMFTWQFPHFLALAYMYQADYRRAGFRFLPETDTAARTGRHIGLGTLAVGASSVLPFALGLTGWVYLALALGAGIGFAWTGWRAAQELTSKSARTAFLASIIYLPILLAALVVDRLVS